MVDVPSRSRQYARRARDVVAARIPRRRPPPAPSAPPAPAAPSPAQQWFVDHVDAARKVIGYLALDGRSLEGRRVADIGTGDGIIALGLATEARPAELVGYDVNSTDTGYLLDQSRRWGYRDDLPANLRFAASTPDRLPADDGEFDALVSWSCFEHVSDPAAMAREMRRIVRDDGFLFLQLWPFYYSQHGSHLMDWYPDGFAHLTVDPTELEHTVRTAHRRDDSDYMWNEYRNLNKVTVDELAAAVCGAGFEIDRAELLTGQTVLPPGVGRGEWPLTSLLVAGVQFTARPV
jgi:ubiquinone/menaquinone biosynthesis C-methylase UbiE